MLKSLVRLLRSRNGKPSADQVATPQDIEACFRLLLGRDPNAEERAGHMLQVGQALGRVVAGYLNSLEFSQRRLLIPDAAIATRVQFDGFHMFASADDAAVGRHILNAVYEPEVTAVLRRTLQQGMTFIDLGANIGYFSMLAAHLVGPTGFVLAVEPNPDNVRLLEASRRSNGFEHVMCMQVAAGRRLGLLMLNATHSNGTTSAIADDLETVLMAKTVACAPLDLLFEGGRRVNLIKIDVEGAEYNALLGAERLLARDHPNHHLGVQPGPVTRHLRYRGRRLSALVDGSRLRFGRHLA